MSSELKQTPQEKPIPKSKPSVANIGIKIFYDSMAAQGVKCADRVGSAFQAIRRNRAAPG